MDPAPPLTDDDILPPVEPRTVYRLGLTGTGMAAAACGVGLVEAFAGDLPWIASTLRVALAFFGLILAGYALSLRAGLWQAWAILAATAGLGSLGLPNTWDSFQMFFRVAAVVAGCGAGLAALPLTVRLSLISVAVLVHFGGILTATTWPDPAPWLTNQVGQRVYMPYLTFMYLRNAYHFYSPEPGPASHVFVLMKYELDEPDPKTGKPKLVSEWLSMPRRDAEQFRDPLGLTYYRRLSLTEMVSQIIPALVTNQNIETEEVKERRVAYSVIKDPLMPQPYQAAQGNVDPINLQYRIPQPHVYKYLLPSYVRHLAGAHEAPGRKVVSMKIYRVEHRIIQPQLFVNGGSPFHPTTYKPYYCGEYTPDGKLVDPQEQMLYWLVPILPKPGGAAPGDPDKIDYDDHMSRHAGFKFNWKDITP